MKAYRIKNDIVAARDEQEAINAWAKHFDVPAITAGPIEEAPLTLEIQVETESEVYRPGTLAEIMPGDDEPAQVLCEGECEGCGN